MVKVKCIDEHSPPMERDVSEIDAEQLLATGKWIISDGKIPKKTPFKEELLKIKGIGNETAEDILKLYPTKKELLSAIKEGKKLPFRNDIEELIKEEL